MRDALEKFDGTGRPPRRVQVDVLNWLADNWAENDTFCIQLPTGSGKSFLARSIQLATNAKVITPSNILVDQYVTVYPQANYLKGVEHYTCSQNKALSCAEWRSLVGTKNDDNKEVKGCKNCPYEKCAIAAANGEPTFFNPMSLYYMLMSRGIAAEAEDVVIVDEAHLLLGMVAQIAGKRFLRSEYHFNEETVVNELELQVFLANALRKATELYELKNREYKVIKASLSAREQLTVKSKAATALRKDLKRAQKDLVIAKREMTSLQTVLTSVEENPQNYAIYVQDAWARGRKDRALHVQPLRPPQHLMRRFLGTGKVILMSGTLPEPDRDDLVGNRKALFYDAPSPIPKEQRPILNRPVPFRMNRDTDVRLIAEAIQDVLKLHPGETTIIHVSYAMSKKLRPFLPEVTVCNSSPQEKVICVDQFKRDGGVFLAAGCAEGLDLTDGFCRVNIVPKLLFPDLTDPVVKKRRTLAGGDRWYDLTTLKWVIQAAGRSTRHEADHSITYVLDPMFARLARRYQTDLPKSFYEAIKWT